MSATDAFREMFGVTGPWPSDTLTAEVHIPPHVLEETCAQVLAAPLLQLGPRARKRVARDPTKAAAWERRKAKVLQGTARALVADNKPEAALALFEVPQKTYDGAFLMTWARAAEQLNAQGVMKTALATASQALEQGLTNDPRVEKLVQRMQAQYGLSSKAAFFAKRYVPISEHGPKHDLARLTGAPSLKIDEALLRWVHAQRSDRDLGLDAFRRRAIWGHNASQFLRDYIGALSDVAGLNMDSRTVQGLRAKAAAICDPVAFDTLTAPLDKGQSVVVVTAHVGFLNLVVRQFEMVDFPLIQIGANAVKAGRETDGSYFLTKGNVHSAFLKLIKTVRKDPHVVVMAADGPYGNDLKALDFLGLPIQLAMGAPTLAYHARAQTFYLGSRWTGDRVAPYLRHGPTPDADTDREAWPDIWFDFYLGCLREVVQGPPENMRFFSGIWQHLSHALQKAAP